MARASGGTGSRRGRRWTGKRIGGVLLILMAVAVTRAQDPENCLSCHRFRGLSRLDLQTNELRLFFCSADYYAHRQGPHARLRCTACHERSEVEVIPHRVRTPVDCTRTCHIAPATGTALRFSHQRVADSLEHSAHRRDNLTAMEFDPPLLRPGQSTCLYCHDEPAFGTRHGVPEGFLSHGGGTRCDTCHAEELPLEITYFANHVGARMRPARTVRQLAQVCAVCHSDPGMVAKAEGHDAVASYLHSFHGKASLLGSTQTATCVECHSSHSGDQHLMLGKNDSDSSTHPEQLPDTCRTAACHPGAPPEMTSAAVHLELDPAKRPPEYFVAALFILLTAAVMLVFFLLIILDLLNSALRKADPEHHRLVRLARLLQDHPEGRKLLQRMTVHQRLQHWGLVITFVLLVYSGMPIKFADTRWAEWLISLVGNLSVARMIHRLAGVGLMAVFLYHIGYLIGQLIRSIRQDRREGIATPLWKRIWYSPMMLTPRDFVQFGQLVAFLLFLRKERPHFGKFSFTQKFEYWAVFWGVPIMGLSGLALWGMPVVTEYLSGRAMNFAFIIHSDEAYLAFIYIATVHLFDVIFAPVVFPLSLGTLSGQAPAVVLAEARRRELETVAAELGVILPHHEHDENYGLPALGTFVANGVRRVYSVALMGGYAALAFFSLRFLILMLTTKQTAPVEIVGIPKRLEPETFLSAVARPVGAGVAPERRPRGPLAHFHQIPPWFQPDPGNTCATAGCHAALPHGKRIEVRAFLNMHATFVDCMVCHAESGAGGRQARWFALPSREPAQTPGILRLATKLEGLTDTQPEDPVTTSAALLGLVEAALPASGQNAQLSDWLVRLQTTNPRSRVFRQIVDEMRLNIHMHVHGEYGAKVGLYEGQRRVGEVTAAQRTASAQFLKRPGMLPETERKALLDIVHQGIAPVGAMCTPCHADRPTLADVSTLGYPEMRLEALRNSPIMRSILTIEAGQPFYLPLKSEGEE